MVGTGHDLVSPGGLQCGGDRPMNHPVRESSGALRRIPGGRVTRHVAILMVLSIAAASCAAENTGPSSSADGTTVTSDATQATATSATPTSAAPDDPAPSTLLPPGEVESGLFDQIVMDLMVRSGAPLDAIDVTRAEQAIWSDGSLGCAEPGETYIQSLVPGYWVVFDVAGETFDYRATENGAFRLCPAGLNPLPPTG